MSSQLLSYTLPKTNSQSTLKMDGFQVRNLLASRGFSPFSGALAVSFREGISSITWLPYAPMIDPLLTPTIPQHGEKKMVVFGQSSSPTKEIHP